MRPPALTLGIGVAQIAPTNADFLAVMGQAMQQLMPNWPGPWVTSINGDPKKAGGKGWHGERYRGQDLPAQNGNYWAICADSGEGRGEDNLVALLAVVRDDVGTKAGVCALSPTMRLETSPGNCQETYRLRSPATDKTMIRRFFAWMVHKGLTDKGASLMARYMRLPVGRNHKEEHGAGGFATAVKEWNPANAFTLEELGGVWGFDLTRDPPTKANAKATCEKTATKPDQEIINGLLRNEKTRKVWLGDDHGADCTGSEADQYLSTRIAFATQDRAQIARIYSEAPRAQRRSSDGTRKWQERPDYRERCIGSALEYVARNPGGNVEEAAALVEAVITGVQDDQDHDMRPLSGAAFLEAMAVLKTARPGDFEFWRKECKALGKSLANLDLEIKGAAGNRDMTDFEAVELVIARLGGREHVAYAEGSILHYQESQGTWGPMCDDALKHVISQEVPKGQIKGAKLRSVLEVLKATIWDAIGFEDCEDKNSVCCANGVLHLTPHSLEGAWNLMPHSPTYRHTASVPHAWDPDAQAPQFERFLASLFEGDKDATEKVKWLKRYIGYSLTTSTDYEKFVILLGLTANNGKSTVLRVLRGLAGDANTSAVDMTQLDGRFGPAALQGKFLCLVPELAPGEALPDKVIKSLCSGDVITAEFKGQDHFDFRPHAKLWIATNHQPRVKDLSPAVINKRAVMLTMNRSFTGGARDHELTTKLTGELPSIFSVCMREWAIALATEGQLALDEPPSSKEAKAAWRSDADSVQQWIDDCIALVPSGWTSSEEVFKSWKRWAERNGVTLACSQQRLTSMLKTRCPSTQAGDAARRNHVRGVLGLTLLDDSAREP